MTSSGVDTITLSPIPALTSADISSLCYTGATGISISSSGYGGSCPTITLNTSGSGYTTTVGSTTATSYTFTGISDIWGGNDQTFLTKFPDWDRIEKMCEIYPALKIAFEKFRTTYRLVKDDYDTPENDRKLP